MLISTWGLVPPPGGNLNTIVYKMESNHWELNLTKLRISRSINYMIMFFSEVKSWWTELVVIFPCPKKHYQFYFNSIDCNTPSGPDMKYSLLSVLLKWADSQFGFWKNSDSFQFLNYVTKLLIQWEFSKKIYVLSKWADYQIVFLDKIILSPNFELSVQMDYPMRILE